MSTRIWGAGSGAGSDNDLSTAANWTGDTLPTNWDSVLFDGTVNTEVTAGLTALAGIGLTSFIVTDEYTGYIGTDTTSCSISAQVFVFSGLGTTSSYFSGSTDATYTTGLESARVTDSSTSVYFTGTIGTLELMKGTTVVETGSIVTTLNCSFIDGSGDVALTIEDSATVTTINQYGGTVTNDSTTAVTTVNLERGTYYHNDANLTTLNQKSGSFYFSAEGHTITLVTITGGTFTCEDNTSAKIITSLVMWPTSVVYLSNDAYNVDVTNGITWYGGKLEVDRGRKLYFSESAVPSASPSSSPSAS